MREILFRGKRTDNGEWEYGDLWCNPYGKRVVCIVSPVNDQGTTGGNEVDPETVGQYTGLLVKNGTKIFEGDFIRKDFGDEIGIIKFGEYRCAFDDDFAEHIGFYVEWLFGDFKGFLRNDLGYWLGKTHHVETIGNIHDNHELLLNEENGG